MNDSGQPSEPLRTQIWALIDAHHAMVDRLSDLEGAARLARRGDLLDAVQEMQRSLVTPITALLKASTL